MDRSERATRGREFRDMRQQLALTQAELAELAGMSVKTVRNIEKGDTVGQASKVQALTTALLKARMVDDGYEVSGDLPSTVIQYGMTVVYRDGRKIVLRVPDADALDEFIERFMSKPEVETVYAEPEFFDQRDVESVADIAHQRWMRSQIAETSDPNETMPVAADDVDPDDDESPGGSR